MDSNALFGLSILMSVPAFGIVTTMFVWPRVRVMRGPDALIPLLIPHTFRILRLSFLIPGVVSPSLSPAFAVPAAYGDLVAAVLADIAILALAARVSWAIPIVWVFNVWCSIDLLHAIYQGQIRLGIDPDPWERRFSSRWSSSRCSSFHMASFSGCYCGSNAMAVSSNRATEG